MVAFRRFIGAEGVEAVATFLETMEFELFAVIAFNAPFKLIDLLRLLKMVDTAGLK